MSENTIEQYKATIEALKSVSLSLNIVVSHSNNTPVIELRKCVTDIETIKRLVSSAYHRVPILILPEFKDTLRSLSSLIDKGILYKEEDKLYFTF